MRHFTPRTVLLSKLALAKYSTICEASSIFFNFLVFQKLMYLYMSITRARYCRQDVSIQVYM